MFRKVAASGIVLAAVLLSATIFASSTDDVAKPADLTVHEWGTFTTIAGPDGKTAEWLPLGGPNDLPCFVDRYQNVIFKSLVVGVPSVPVDYYNARKKLLGSVRMETPVLYFYSPEARKVQVKVDFPRGFITEWYPDAGVKQNVVGTDSLRQANTGASISWPDVEVLPRDAEAPLLRGESPSHYYAARATDANPIRVGSTNEKFLFYRGVGGFPVPINVTVTKENKIFVKYLTDKPSVILFENRGGNLGYRIVDVTKDEALLDPPSLTADFESLRNELERALVGQGLYVKEAKAMVDTWRDSWFEEGTRLFYIVPPQMVKRILPLAIEPKPAQVARVFVGRVEVITPGTVNAVEHAINANDEKTLEAYGRFLGPITDRIAARNPAEKDRISSLLNSFLSRYASTHSGCAN
jgi:hypothetical protein